MKHETRSTSLPLAAFIAATVVTTLLPSHTTAQAYPSKPIRIVLGFAAGAPGEFAIRLMADKMFAASKQPLVIENRAGAGGNIATEFVARAALGEGGAAG